MTSPVVSTNRTHRTSRGAGLLALAIALVAVLGAIYLALDVPLGIDAITSST